MARTNKNTAAEDEVVTKEAEIVTEKEPIFIDNDEYPRTEWKAEPVPPAVRAALLTPTQAVSLRAGQLLVICSRPGFRRAGVEHQHVKIWDQGELTPEQIVELQREPLITVVEISAP